VKFAREWLRKNIHLDGATCQARELIQKLTGEDLNPAYFQKYLEDKFSEIYRF
jgi:carboxypeptidase Taq